MFTIFSGFHGLELVKDCSLTREFTSKVGRRQGVTDAVISEVVNNGSVCPVDKGDVRTTLIGVMIEAGLNLDLVVLSLSDSFRAYMFNKLMSVDCFLF